ncbi:MAG: hypothetical protein NXY57DRAFT_1044350 [Lentinula lateritia]|nr:MAG: hypothetical protein NXY57DRAFT_1044350 [Lentinula lateritia]
MMNDLVVDIYEKILNDFCSRKEAFSLTLVTRNSKEAADRIIFKRLELKRDPEECSSQLWHWQEYDRTGRLIFGPQLLRIPAYPFNNDSFIANILRIPSIRKNVRHLSFHIVDTQLLQSDFSFFDLQTVYLRFTWDLWNALRPILDYFSKATSGGITGLAIDTPVLGTRDPLPVLSPLQLSSVPVSVKKLLLPSFGVVPHLYPWIPCAILSASRISLAHLRSITFEIKRWWEDDVIRNILNGMTKLEELIIDSRERPETLSIINFPTLTSLQSIEFHGNISYHFNNEVVYLPGALKTAIDRIGCTDISKIILGILYSGPSTMDDDLETQESFEWQDFARFLVNNCLHMKTLQAKYWVYPFTDLWEYHTCEVESELVSILPRGTLVVFRDLPFSKYRPLFPHRLPEVFMASCI